MTTTKMTVKKLIDIVKPPPKHWVGNGFHVHSMFSYDDNPELISPFLLLDFMAPETYPPSQGERRGVGEHPHRGFETVTILHSGEVEHRDSGGNHGKLGPGDVQWMTAASGVVHEEKHSQDFTRKGGVFEGAQLWVNLPKQFKMSKPKYQDIASSRIPTVPPPEGAGMEGGAAGMEGVSDSVCGVRRTLGPRGTVRVARSVASGSRERNADPGSARLGMRCRYDHAS
jgi:redox-sensitive bicupin YhaK (pirin superfamily)